jgi:hypothetical protein
LILPSAFNAANAFQPPYIFTYHVPVGDAPHLAESHRQTIEPSAFNAANARPFPAIVTNPVLVGADVPHHPVAHHAFRLPSAFNAANAPPPFPKISTNHVSVGWFHVYILPREYTEPSAFNAANHELLEIIFVYHTSLGPPLHHLSGNPHTFMLPSLFNAAKAAREEYIFTKSLSVGYVLTR